MTTFIKVDGKDLPAAFTMRAINHFCVKHNLTVGQSFAMLSSGDEANPISLTYDQIADLAYFALKEGHRLENEKMQIKSSDEVFDMFDKEPGLLTKVITLYGESLAKKWAADDPNGQAPKANKK